MSVIDNNTQSRKLSLCFHLSSLFPGCQDNQTTLCDSLTPRMTHFFGKVANYYRIYAQVKQEDKNIPNLLKWLDPSHTYFEPYGETPPDQSKTIHIGDELNDNDLEMYMYHRPLRRNHHTSTSDTANHPSPSSSLEDYTHNTDQEDLNALAQGLISIYEKSQLNEEEDKIRIRLMRWKAQILAGVTCTFSGVIPNDQDATRSRFWKLATSYGAHCCLDLTGKVTHLIASRTGTTKVNKAKHYQRIHIVSLAWLLESVSQCTMQDETLYPLISSLPASAVVTPVSTPLGDEDELLLLEEKEEGLSENKSKTDKWKQQDMREDGTATETPSVNTSNGTTSNHEDNNNLDLETEFHDIDHIDWDEADKEVNDYMNESGTDDNYSSGPDSPLPIGAVINNNNNNNNNRKRKRPNASSLVFRRAKAAVRGPSRLSNMVRVNDTGTSDEDEENNQETGSQKQHSYKRDDDDDDDDNSSSSSLSSFAGELDDEIE